MALAYLLIQQVEGNFLVPKVMERVVGLHPFLVLASVLIGGALLGILGVLLAVPVAAVADALVTELIFEPAGLNEPSDEEATPRRRRGGHAAAQPQAPGAPAPEAVSQACAVVSIVRWRRRWYGPSGQEE